MALTPLKRTPAERKDKEAQMQAGPEVDQYPYGCALDLATDELDKLGVKELPEVGDLFHIKALGKVTRVSANEHSAGRERSICIQLTHLELTEDAAEETAESPAKEASEQRGLRPVTAIGNAMRGTKGA